jgi:hypothetical protein
LCGKATEPHDGRTGVAFAEREKEATFPSLLPEHCHESGMVIVMVMADVLAMVKARPAEREDSTPTHFRGEVVLFFPPIPLG